MAVTMEPHIPAPMTTKASATNVLTHPGRRFSCSMIPQRPTTELLPHWTSPRAGPLTAWKRASARLAHNPIDCDRSDYASPRHPYWDKRGAADRSANPCGIKNGLVG